MAYTLGEAARATGRGKTTLQEAIRKGRITAEKDPFGCWRIEPAELHRVYPPHAGTKPDPVTGPTTRARDAEPFRTPGPDEDTVRLQERVAGLERLCRQVEGERDHLREQLREQNARLTALLPRPAPVGPDRAALWPRLRRRLGLFSQD